MGTEGKRLKVIKKIMSTLIAAHLSGKEIVRKKLEANLCLSEGFTRRKAQEYINLLIDAEKAEERDGRVFLSEDEIKERELDGEHKSE